MNTSIHFNIFYSNAVSYNHFIIFCLRGMKNALKFNDMNLELGAFGIKVTNLDTSNPEVLAGGDCVEKIHYVKKTCILKAARPFCYKEFRLGNMELVNRFVFPPIKLGYGSDGAVTDRQLKFYQQMILRVKIF